MRDHEFDPEIPLEPKAFNQNELSDLIGELERIILYFPLMF